MPGDIDKFGENPPLSLLLKPGMRGISVEVSSLIGAGGLIRPGDRVDVILSVKTQGASSDGGGGAGGENQVAATILQNLEVVAIGQTVSAAATAQTGEEGAVEDTVSDATTVTLAATPIQSEVLALADICKQNFDGRVSLAVRGAGDAERFAASHRMAGRWPHAGLRQPAGHHHAAEQLQLPVEAIKPGKGSKEAKENDDTESAGNRDRPDEPQGRDEVQKMLALSGFGVVGEAGYGIEAVSLAKKTEPEVVVIAVEEPLSRSLQTVEAMADLLPKSPIIGHSSIRDATAMRKAMVAGAEGLPSQPGQRRGTDQLHPHSAREGSSAPKRWLPVRWTSRSQPAP